MNFDIATDPNVDQILTQMRQSQAASQLAHAGDRLRRDGAEIDLVRHCCFLRSIRPHGTYNNIFLANYANINLNDALTRVRGIASITVFGAGQYAMRIWVNP